MWVLEPGILYNKDSKQATYVTEKIKENFSNTVLDDEDLMLFVSEVKRYLRNANSEFSRCRKVELNYYERNASNRYMYVSLVRSDRVGISVASYTLRHVEKKIF